MKRKNLLFLLLLAFIAPWAAFGQETLTVYDGTTTNRNVPMYVYYFDAFARSQYIIPAADLQDMACGTINSIHYYTSFTSAYTTACNVIVSMKEVDYTTLSSFVDMSDATTVYNGIAEFTLVDGKAEITFNFSTSFAYNGGNLLIECKNDAKDTYKTIYFYGQSVSYNSAVYSSSSSATPTSGGTTQQFIPKTNFTYTPTPYTPPASISYTNNEPGNTTVSWTAPNATETVTGYGYRYKLTSDADWPAFESVDATVTSVTLASLAFGEEYEFEVKALYGTNESCVAKDVTFTTLEACMTPENLTISDVTAHAATLTWTEGFGDGEWVLQYKLSTEEEYTNSVDVALADLPYTLTGLTAESTYNVQISPVCDDTKTLTGNFTTTVACFAPTNLAVEANVQTATFTWVSDVNNYEIAHATVATADPIDNIVGTATDTVYSMSDLTIDTDHYFWVRSNCGSEGYSAWTGPVSVHIGYCVPNPSTRDGKGITKVIFGIGDNIVNNVDETNGLPATTPFYGNYSSMVGAMQAGVESTISITYATGSNTVYSYGTIIWVDWDNSLSFEDSEIVYTGTSAQGSGGVPQVLEASFTVPVNQATGEYRMRIAGADSYFDSYIGGSSTGNHSACFSSTYAVCHDYTLRVLEAPTCYTPTGVTAFNVTAHEATISWTSDANEWQIQLNDEEAIDVTETTYTFTGLDAETNYSVKVRTNCNDTGSGYSEWTTPINFTTTIACPVPTELAASAAGATATITWNSQAAAFNIDINGTVTENVTSPYVINGEFGTSYTVKVQAVCGGIDGESEWTNPISFTTDACLPENMCAINIALTDSYSDGWNGGKLEVVDVETEVILGTYTLTSGSSGNYTLNVCDGRTINIVYTAGSYSTENGWVVTDINDEVICEHVGCNSGCTPTAGVQATYTMNCTVNPCQKPTNLAVNYEGGTEAIVTWEGEATSYNIDVNGTVTEGVTSPYTLEGLEMATTYEVKVQADCGDNGISDWTNPVSFTTDLCLPENMCEITFELTDSYGDGWNGGELEVVDAETSEILGTYTLTSGGSGNYTLNVCDGRTINIVYTAGNYSTENGWVVTDINNEVICEHVGCNSGCTPTEGVQATYTVSCTVSPCKKPTDLVVSEIGPRSAVLSWTENGEATEWEVEITNLDIDSTIMWTAVTNPYTMLYLDPETNYSVRVLPHCEIEKWSDPITFTTDVPCPAPTVTFSNVTAHTADVSCNGYAANYEMEYAIAGISGSVTYDFEDGTLQGWTNLINAEGGQWLHSNDNGGAHDYTGLAHSGTSFAMCYSFIDGVGSFETDAYLVSPNRYQISENASLNFWYDFANDTYPEYTEVCIATATNPTADDFTAIWNSGSAKGSNGLRAANANRQSNTRYQNWREVTLDLSDYAGQSIWIAFHDENYDAYEIWIDDVTVNLDGELTWTPVGTVTSPYTLSDLDPETAYMVRARANCGEDGESEWSSIATFTTFDLIVWNVDEDWPNDSVPEAYADVTIPANTEVIIPSGYTAYADTITLGENSQIIMEPGAQFYHSNEVPVTVQMNVIGYNTGSKDGVGRFYLIASPINPSISAPAAGLIPESNEDPAYAGIDLYLFDQVGDGQGNEWLNYKVANFDLNLMQGYLYASDATITAMFAGQTVPTNVDLSKELEYVDDADLPGVNLVGNPFTCTAYINGGESFYTMNDNGDEIITTNNNTIEPMQGIFVGAEQAGESVTFTTDPGTKGASLALNLSQGRSTIDRAIVRFDEGRQLRKFQLNPNHTKVYIPMNGKDYAVVTAEEMGEMPVNFKAEKNGSYTMSFTAEEVSFNYLHLIDNMTGADVDLLATPSYTFNAQTTDYATRFRLVFATGNNSTEDFAFFSNGNLVINNEGNATLQVVDVMGRILSNETINGSASINISGAAGVYMIRLINGNDVKVQKVIIK